MRILSLLTLLFACYTNAISQNDIQGPVSVCEDECHTYSLNSTQTLYWTITGGVVDNNVGEEVEICWKEAQTGEINASSIDGIVTANLSVIINKSPEATILFPLYPICNSQDSIDFQTEFQANDFCKTVCGGGTSFFELANYNSGSSYSWIVTGDNNHITSTLGINIEWPEEGYGSVILVEETSAGCVDSNYVCIEILEEPSIDIQITNNQIDLANLCQNQNIYLEAISNQSLTYSWISSDGQSSDGATANFSFDKTGNYEITLFGQTDCFCTVEKTIEVVVIDFVSPTIDCLGTTCASEEMTYYAADICGGYNWTVGPNGMVIEGGQVSDNYITIEWSSGPTGVISLSTSSCDDSSICTEPVVELIPVIGSSVFINGPDEVCNNEKNVFTTQQYEGANYTWNLTGNGYIISGNGTHEITVQWNPYPGSGNLANLTVDIENCFLGCSSHGEKEVKVEEPFSITSRPTYCEGDNGYFFAFAGYDGAKCDWTLVTPSNSVIALDSGQSDLYIDFLNGTGIYEVIAIANSDDYCNKEERTFIEVLENPIPITEIQGSDFICIGESYAYSINSPRSNLSYIWDFTDGINAFQFHGEEVYYQWTSTGPYTISVEAYDQETACTSEPFIKELFPVGNATLEGNQTSCEDEIVEYVLLGIEAFNIEWSLFPDILGVVIPNQDNTVKVQWLNDGNATLTASYCGEIYTINVEVVDEQTGLIFDSGLCPGELGEIKSDSGTTIISVTDENGNTVSNIAPIVVGPGHFEIEASDIYGCINYSAIFIENHQAPAVNISSRGLDALCVVGGKASLEALVTNDGLSYAWFKDGINLNINASKLQTGDPGSYRVEVTDNKGCEGFDVLEVECVESICDCRPDGGVRYNYQRGAFCNEFDFTNTSFDYIAGSLVYDFNDPGSINNITTDENPSHIFSEAGHFIVSLEGIVPHATIDGAVCPAQFIDFITVEAVSDFTSLPACSGEPMEFFESANFLPDFSIANYEWDFGDLASGIDNISTDADPVHVFANAGIYDVSLTITTNTGCKSIKTKTVSVHQGAVLDFDIPSSTCVGDPIRFLGITGALNVLWDFDDSPGTFVNNKEAYHIYDTPGDYDVSFSASNIYDCISTVTKTITVVDNPFAGTISFNKVMPMCEGEEVTLDGPSGGFAYLWNTGETTPSITTRDGGIYSVTVTSIDGCEYIPEPVLVNTIKPVNPIISGYIYDGGFEATIYQNEMEICEGEFINLGVQYFSNASYLWSTGEMSNYLGGSSVNGLSPGDHVFTITVTEANFNCAIESDPFTIIVHPRPDAFQIESNQPGNCEGVEYTFSVINPDAQLNYYWNNGMAGESITVSSPGIYQAEAFNAFGCKRSSNKEQIFPLPNISRVLTGCQEACFPDTLCVAYSPSITNYTWFLDGVAIPGIDQDELVINEVGDYQVELINAYGCIVTSDILNISPKTNEQTLDGVVFMDTNGNGIHDVGEELIIGASVNIISGSTVLSTQITDSDGTYLFDPAPISNAQVVLDTFGLGLNLSVSTLLYSFELKSCNEDLTQDFPLNKVCIAASFDVTLYTCPGEMAEYEGEFYNAGDNAMVTIIDDNGCESSINLEVLSYGISSYQLIPFPTCTNLNDGILEIDIISGNGLQFSIDNGLNFTSNPEFYNLSAGNYDLLVMDINGCIENESFIISEHSFQAVNFVTSNTCQSENDGTLTIDNSASANMQFAIDDNSSFSQVSVISGLSSGDHVLYVLDDNGCTHEYNFSIGVYAEPELTFDTYDSCTGHYLGALFVISTDLSLDFSLNGVDYSSQTDYLDLEIGEYTLYVETADNCVFTYDFAIGSFGLIDIDIETKNTCLGESTGEIIVLDGIGLEFSIDGLNFQGSTGFSDLAAGDYTIYAQDDNQCPTEIQVTIEEIESQELFFTEPMIDCSTKELELGLSNDATNPLTYNWSNGGTSSSIVIQENGIYEVEIDDGCSVRAHSWDITFEETHNIDSPAFVPNIFSPDSEDVNAQFKPLVNDDIILLEYSFSIFDRWGNKLFHSEDNQEYWSGLFNDEQVDPGVFVWRIEMKYSGCQEPEKFEKYGDVTLIR